MFEHGGKSEELSVDWLVDQNFLLVFVDGGDVDCTGEENVGSAAGVSVLVNTLARGKGFQLYLLREYGEFVVIEQREKGDVAEFLWVARHGGV